MFTVNQINAIVDAYNDNKKADASTASANNSLKTRYLDKLERRGYSASTLAEYVANSARTNGNYHNIYDLLTSKALKSAGIMPSDEPAPTPASEPSDEPTSEPTSEPAPTPASEPAPTPAPTPVADGLTSLLVTACKPTIHDEVSQQIAQFASSGAIEKPLTIITPSKKVTTSDKHERFEMVLSAVANYENLYLYGPAGSGKNVICSQVADALGLKFYYTNNVMQEHQLKGYSDANGIFHETPFYQAFKNGGLFMLDELDASIPPTLTMLNGAISNGYFVFGNGEQVTAHKDFHCIAAGNTLGTGATSTYTRNRLDGATLNRFSPLYIDYSRKIENSLASADVVEFCRDFRKACKSCGIEHVVSYRNIISLNRLAQLWSERDAVQASVVRELSTDDVNMLKSELDMSNRFASALYA